MTLARIAGLLVVVVLLTVQTNAFVIVNPTMLQQKQHTRVDSCLQMAQDSSATTMTTTETSSSSIATKPNAEVVSSMPPPLPSDTLKNRYFLLRHGQSTANVAGIISSSRSLAYSDRHGLTPLGYEQGVNSSEALLDLLSSSSLDKTYSKLKFISSPFARAYQTAQACLDGLVQLQQDETQQDRFTAAGITDLTDSMSIAYDDELMERWFGRLDGEPLMTYAYIWPMDRFNVTHTTYDVESVAAVATRLRRVILRLEEQYEGYNLVLTSHADVLQILQQYGANVDNVGEFSSYRFGNGEVRFMDSTPESLPEPKPMNPPMRLARTE